MPLFQDAKEQADQEILVNLLTRLSEDPTATQRSLAQEMGVALGMMSRYMKSCVRKGFLRVKQVAPRRWAYFVTPKGFSEKSNMVVTHLSHAMTFFRDTRIQLEQLFKQCLSNKIHTIGLVGPGDVADIAQLVAHNFQLKLSVTDINSQLIQFDAILITDTQNPQGTYENLKLLLCETKILMIPALCITRRRVVSLNQLKNGGLN